MKRLTKFLADYSSSTMEYENFSISVIREPSVVFPASQISDFTDEMIDEVRIVAAGSFGVEPGSREGIKNHVLTVDALAFLHRQEDILGFASARLFPVDDTFYLHGVTVSPAAKGKGAGAALVKTLVGDAGMRRIAFTTQNPIMFCLLRSLAAWVFPSPKMWEIPSRLHNLGTRLVSGRHGVLDPSTFIIRSLYSKCLYRALPVSRDAIVNDWFSDVLGVVDGITRDGFLFVGEN